MISAGAMNRRVRIERATESRDPKTNARVLTWSLLAEVWAHRRDTSAREFFAAGASGNTEQVAVFTTWFRPGITPQMRLIDSGQAWNITGVTEIGQRQQLQIQAAAVNSNPKN